MATLNSIIFSDFKKFGRFTVSARQGNVLVGPNNAGKSSILDALRLLGDALRHSRSDSPMLKSQGEYGVCATFSLPRSSLSIPIENSVRNYGNDFAKIDYKLSNGCSVHFRIHPDRGVHVFLSGIDRAPRRSIDFRRQIDLNVVVVPTLSSLEEDEAYVQDKTARRNENTRLASRNFRNIIYRLNDKEFEEFCNWSKEGWPDIEISRPVINRGHPPRLYMMFSEARIEREVFWCGFGFQVWMQMMLQFRRADENSILVLDEPDIYLHPELQRRLLRLARRSFSQLFMATHSTEIINEADPGEILSVDASNRSARRIATDDGYRRVYSYLGSSENAEFSRIAKADRIVFFEGKERNLIRKLARKVGADDLLDDPRTLYLQAGGFSQWRRIKEVDWTLQELFGINARMGALFDRDYRPEREIAAFEQKIASDSLWVRVLRRKEIENYALSEASVTRTIIARALDRDIELSEATVHSIILKTLEKFEEECRALIIASHLAHYREAQKGQDESTHIKNSNEIFATNWSTIDGRFQVVPGKDYISFLSAVLQKNFGITITVHQLIDEMKAEEVDAELGRNLADLSHFFSDE